MFRRDALLRAVNTFPPFPDLVPHGRPMVLLDEMVEWEPGRAVCNVTLRPDAPFVEGDSVDALATIEYMAQAVAACLGYEAYRGGAGVRVGMIIASKRFTLHQDSVPVGAHVVVSVRRVRGNELLSHFEGDVHADEVLVSDAQLTLFHAEKPPE